MCCLFGNIFTERASQLLAQALDQQVSESSRPNARRHCSSSEEAALALQKGGALLEQSRFQDAAAVSRALFQEQCEPRAALLLAAALEGTGDLSGAKQALQQAHSIWPANNSIATSLARDYLHDGEVSEAGQALNAFHLTRETSAQELQMAAVVFLANHRLAAAQQAAQASYAAQRSLQSLLLLANTYQLEGKYKDVLALLHPHRSMYDQSAPFLITLAESEYDAKIFDAAHTDLEEAIKLDPRSYQAHYLLGNVLMSSSDVDRAVSEYRSAIELAPEQPRTYYQLAIALRAKEDEAGEEKALEQTLALDDKFALAHAELGRMLVGQNRLPDAVTQLRAAIQANPEF